MTNEPGEHRPENPEDNLRNGFTFDEGKDPEVNKSKLEGVLEGAVVAAGANMVNEGAERIRGRLWGGTGKRQKLSEVIRSRKGNKNQEENSQSKQTSSPVEDGSNMPPGQPPEGPPQSSNKENKERPEPRPFTEIQKDLVALINNPDPAKETQLKMERARLLSDAKDWQLFDSLKRHIVDLQNSNTDFVVAEGKITGIDTETLEAEFRGAEGWDERWTGMLDEYKDGTLLNMGHALLQAEGKTDQGVLDKLKREIEIRVWGLPRDVEPLAIKYVESKNSTATSQPSELGQAAKEIARAARILAGEIQLELPDNIEQQRALIRDMLETVEKSNKDCNDPVNGITVRKLEVSLEKMFPEISEEVVTRLAIHDSSELIKQAAGFIEPRKDGGINITAALGESQRRLHDLTQRVVDIFYKEGLPGLNLPKAWNLLEDANYHYRDVIGEINTLRLRQVSDRNRLSPQDRARLISVLNSVNYDKIQLDKPAQSANKTWLISKIGASNIDLFVSTYGTTVTEQDKRRGQVPTNHYMDSNVSRSEAVREYIIAKLALERDSRTADQVGDHNARTAYNIALKMAKATLETSVWNKSAVSGNDELGEIIDLRDYRLRRRAPGRSRGPMIHEEAIPGFGNSWIRLKRSGDIPDDTTQPLYSEDVDVAKVDQGPGSYAAYGPGILNRYKAVENLLLDRAPEPGKIDINTLQDAVPYFNTCDPMSDEDKRLGYNTGKLVLRVWWLAGVVDMALARKTLAWDRKSLDDLKITCTRLTLSDEAGPFISEDQWRDIEAMTRYGFRVQKLGAVNHLDSLSYSGGGGGGKKRK